MQRMFIFDVLTKLQDSFAQNRKRDLRQQLHCRIYAKYERSIHVFMNSSEKFMNGVLNQSFFSCPSILVDLLVFQQ